MSDVYEPFDGDQPYSPDSGYSGGLPPPPVGPLDVETALVRVLADWLRTLVFQRSGTGHTFRLADVREEWPAPEVELSAYPVAAVIPMAERTTEDHFTVPHEVGQSADGKLCLFAVEAVLLRLQVDLWCASAVERQDVVRVLDEERMPFHDTAALVLPAGGLYWQQQFRYSWTASRRWQGGEEVKRGDWRQTLTVEGRSPVIRPVPLPQMRPVVLDPRSKIGPDVDPNL